MAIDPKNAVKATTDTAKDVVKDVGGVVGEGLENLANDAVSAAKGLVGGALDAAKSLACGALGALAGAAGQIIAAANGLVNEALGALNAVKNLAKNIDATARQALATAKNLAATIKNSVGSIKAQLAKIKKAGIKAQLKKAIQDGKKKLIDTIKSFKKFGIKGAVGSFVNAAKKGLKNLTSNVLGGLLGATAGTVSNVVNCQLRNINNTINTFQQSIGQFAGLIKSQITDRIASLTGKLTGGLKQVQSFEKNISNISRLQDSSKKALYGNSNKFMKQLLKDKDEESAAAQALSDLQCSVNQAFDKNLQREFSRTGSLDSITDKISQKLAGACDNPFAKQTQKFQQNLNKAATQLSKVGNIPTSFGFTKTPRSL